MAFAEDIREELLKRLADGESMVAIAQDARMPSRETVRRWNDSDETFRARYARARERELIAELMPTENKCPGGNGGRAAPKPKPRKTQWEKELEAIEKMGPRKYAARWLLINAETIMRYLPASKLDVNRLRQVAYGCGA